MGKEIVMVAWPNGAGKTTMMLELFAGKSGLNEFINADEIAKGLAPLNPESVALTASKLMMRRFKELVDEGRSFAFETTGAGKGYVKHLKEAKRKGYGVHLTFLWLAGPKQAMARVAERVKQGGHFVPEETIVRRYYAGLTNVLNHYLLLANTATIWDNSSEASPKKLIAIKHEDFELDIVNESAWKRLKEASYEH